MVIRWTLIKIECLPMSSPESCGRPSRLFSSEDPPEPEPPPLLPPTRIFFLRILWILEASWMVCSVSLWWLGSGEMWARRATCNIAGSD